MAVEKHALNKKERALMHVLLNLAEKNDEGVCLVKPLEIFEALPYDYPRRTRTYAQRACARRLSGIHFRR